MNPIYVVLGGLLCRVLGKKIGFWYTHRNVDMKLRIAEKFTDYIFTASYESFRLKSKKLHVVGHGIDVKSFKCDGIKKNNDNNTLKILHVGRITQIKNIDVLVEAAHILNKTWESKFHILLIGEPVIPSDFDYKKKLAALIEKYNLQNNITFKGSVSNTDIKSYYCNSDTSVNLAPTGGVDKAVLESMAAGRPVFASNTAFEDYFGEYSDKLLFQERDSEGLAEKIISFFSNVNYKKAGIFLSNQARNKTSVNILISNIISILKK